MAARHRLSAAQVSGALLPWLPVMLGIGIMAGFTVYAAARQVGSESAFEVPVDPTAVVEPSPSVTATPPISPPVTSPPAPTSPPPTSPPPTSPPPEHPPTTSPPPPPGVIGTYKLAASFEHEFIGKIVITNDTDHAEDWTVELAFPENVGKVLAFWVDGEWQPEGRRLEDNSLVFTSTAPVEAHSHVVLKIRFARSGHDVDPDLCKVNGTLCRDG